MLALERQEDIVRRVNQDGSIRVKELSALYSVTEDCIRKDLAQLEKDGLLKRTYGGAVTVRRNERDLGVSSRRRKNVAGKHAIAEKALEMIRDGDMVFMDISTANTELARLLAASELDITVVTNMIEVMQILAVPVKLRTICIGGEFNRTYDGFVGNLADEQIRPFRFDIAFMGAVGIDVFSGDVLTYMPEDGRTKAGVLERARRACLLFECRKFRNTGDYAFAEIGQFSDVILDGEPPAEEMTRLKEFGASLHW